VDTVEEQIRFVMPDSWACERTDRRATSHANSGNATATAAIRVTHCERVAMPPSPANFVVVFPSLIDERSDNERAGYSLHVDDNLSSRVSLLQIADRLRNVAQSVTPVDDRCDLASLHQLAHEGQILVAQPRQKHVKVLAHKP
jgi:hypothetical protein